MEKVKNLWNLLRITFILVPIIAGVDKFLNLLVDWEVYLGPLMDIIPFDATIFMYIVGIIEIVAGVIVFAKTEIGGYIVMAWLISIAIVLTLGGYYDIAVRDLVIAVAAFVMAQLTQVAPESNKVSYGKKEREVAL